MKRCTKCGVEKPVSEFYKQAATSPTKDGLTYHCKACYAAYYRANSKRQRHISRRAAVLRMYGLTLEEYRRLIAEGCRVCGSQTKVFMDHCHATNRVRAPLCQGCNMALGAVRDDPDRLEALARFIREGNFVGTAPVPPPPRYRGPDEATLRRMYVDEGKSISEIARELGRSFEVTRSRIHYFGIEVRPARQDVDDDEIVRLYVDERLSLLEVSKRVGMGAGGVRKRLLACGVEMRSAGGASHAARLR